MFCSKCGKQLNDDAKFCDSCGFAVGSATQTSTPEQQAAPIATPKKTKKPKKAWYKRWWVWALAVLVLIIVVASIGGDDIDESAGITVTSSPSASPSATPENEPTPTETSTGIVLSQTLSNETEGITFDYPDDWEIISEGEFVDEGGSLLTIRPTDEFGPILSVAFEIYRGFSSQAEIDEMFSYTISDFQRASGDDVTVNSLDDIDFDGVPARKMTAATVADMFITEYRYAIGTTVFRLVFSCMLDEKGVYEPIFDAIMDSYKITQSNTTQPQTDNTAATGNIVSDPVLMYTDNEFTAYGFAIEVPDFFPFTSYENKGQNGQERYDSIYETESGVVYTYNNYDFLSDGYARYCSLLESMGFTKTSVVDWEYYSKENVGVSIWINEDGTESMKHAEISIFHDYPEEISVSYDGLARFPDDYMGVNVTFTGKVLQVLEGDNAIDIRLATKYGEYEIDDDILYVTYDKPLTGGRILAGDIIVVYGKSDGLITGETVLGAEVTLPLIRASEIIQ